MTATAYGARDFVHFLRMLARNKNRQRRWGARFESAVANESFRVEAPAVVQLIPTEACNLRCPMCNQWGENGYFPAGARGVEHMSEADVTALLADLSPRESLVSVHGGEPFAYRHIGSLLARLEEGGFDTIFTTNGTLLDKWITPLARIKNLALLLSIDGNEQTHDKIRGAGTFQTARSAMRKLFDARAALGYPKPLLVLSLTVCEWNVGAIDDAFDVARSFGAFGLNYNLRWFLSEEAGTAYERHLKEHFDLRSSGAWRGWISNHPDADYTMASDTLAREMENHRRRVRPPFVFTTPKGLRGADFRTYFDDFGEVFGNESCFMPFYWARVHSNGDLIFCPGHPDIIAGNVFRDGVGEAFNSERARRFRRHMLGNRMPICNRCCGLYMTSPGRPYEQRARRRLGLPKRVNAAF